MAETEVDHINVQLNQYLVRPSNHSILLTGGWGTGKTYYLKNKFFPTLKSDGYKPIIISLFGVTNIDDVKERIFLELYPWTDNKYLNLTKSIGKAFLKAADVSKFLGGNFLGDAIDAIDDASKEIYAKKFSFLNLDKLLICFDDVDRADPLKLTSNQLLGFINSLVEDSNIKVIVVASEDKIFSADFKEIKEKTISHTIHFVQDFKQTFNEVLLKKDFAPKYNYYLINHIDSIHTMLSDEQNNNQINYRTASYFITAYYDIYNYVNMNLTIEDLQFQKKDILFSLMQFCMLICKEFKNGAISYLKKNGLDSDISIAILKYVSDKIGPDKEPSYASLIVEKYFPEDNYHFYLSVYNYLTGGCSFNGKQLIDEIYKQYNVVSEKISPAYKTYQKLNYPEYLNLSDTQYIWNTRKMKDYAIEGNYDIWEYDSIFFRIFRFGNVLNLNPNKIASDFVKAIEKKRTSNKYNISSPQYYKKLVEGEYMEQHNLIREAAIKINDESKKIQNRLIVKTIENDLKNDFFRLFERMMNSMKESFDRPTMDGVNPNLFYKVYINAPNKQREKMAMLIQILYKSTYENNTYEDFEFLWNLEKLIYRRLVNKPIKNISGELIIKFHKILLESIKNRAVFSITNLQ